MLLEVWRKGHKFVFKNMAGMLNKILQKYFPKDVFFKTAVMQICNKFTGGHPCRSCYRALLRICKTHF